MNAGKNDMDIKLSLLECIAESPNISQRKLSKKLGLALGLTNSYLKKCIAYGLVKIEQIPANCYLYYLTPKGFAEKSRLMSNYLTDSMRIFREIRAECMKFYASFDVTYTQKLAIIGSNDLSEVARLVAKNYNVQVDVFESLEVASGSFDYWLIADLADPQVVYDALAERVSSSQIMVFSMLKVAVLEEAVVDVE